jgi:hypothetical protein
VIIPLKNGRVSVEIFYKFMTTTKNKHCPLIIIKSVSKHTTYSCTGVPLRKQDPLMLLSEQIYFAGCLRAGSRNYPPNMLSWSYLVPFLLIIF